jgi:Na+/citrate or Na+/malate symporter
MTAFLANLPVNPVLQINLILGVLLFRLALKIYVVPNLATWSPAKLLTPILLLHMLRELGLMFMFPGATLPGMPDAFSVPAALGDFMAAVLATVALFAVQRGSSLFNIQPKTWVWIFNIWGTVDLIVAITLAVVFKSAPHLGASYWIPAFWVPMLLATHALVFVYLRKHRK